MRIVALISILLMLLAIGSCSTNFGVLETGANGTSGDDDEYLPEPDEFVPVEVLPEMTYYAEPDYPRLAYQAGIEGVVWVQSLVDMHGVVREALIAKSSGTIALDEAAVKAAYHCCFTPAIQNGRPVACWVVYKVEFKIDG